MATKTAAKAPPTVNVTSQKLTKDTGASSTDRITSNGAVTLTGTVSATSGTTVKIYDGAAYLGTATVDSNGGWKFTTTLGDGTHALNAVASNQWGSGSSAVQPVITVDTSTPVVAYRYETQTAGSNTVDLWGTVTGSPGTKVEIFSGSTSLGLATVAPDGSWHLQTASLAPGNYSFKAVATTLAGKSSTFSGIPSLTVGPAFGTLDMTKFTKVWGQDFTTSTSVNRDIFPIVYGDPSQFSFGPAGLTLSSSRADGFPNVGILQENWGSNLAQGYGLYTVTASVPAYQGMGIAILLWPSNNIWPGPELDLLENWSDPTGQTGYFSAHFKGPDGGDMANSIKFSVDLTKPNTFALDWERGSLSYYINGQLIFKITGSEVPRDASDGGVNMSFGAQITDIGDNYEPTDLVQLTIADMSYYASNSAGALLNAQTYSAAGTTVQVSPDVQALSDAIAQSPSVSTFMGRHETGFNKLFDGISSPFSAGHGWGGPSGSGD